MTPAQLRAARAMIGMEQSDLAKLASVARSTIVDFENETRKPRVASIASIQAALETAGVVFLDQNGNGPGVALSRPDRPGLDPIKSGLTSRDGPE